MGIPTEPFHEIGSHAQIDADVILGYRYPGDSQPMRIGDYAIIRSGSIVYANTVIGHRFQCGHQVLIRAEVTIGDRCVVHHASRRDVERRTSFATMNRSTATQRIATFPRLPLEEADLLALTLE